MMPRICNQVLCANKRISRSTEEDGTIPTVCAQCLELSFVSIKGTDSSHKNTKTNTIYWVVGLVLLVAAITASILYNFENNKGLKDRVGQNSSVARLKPQAVTVNNNWATSEFFDEHLRVDEPGYPSLATRMSPVAFELQKEIFNDVTMQAIIGHPNRNSRENMEVAFAELKKVGNNLEERCSCETIILR